MIYKRIKPHPSLQSFVEEIMFFSMTDEESMTTMTKVLPPSPEHGIEFLPKGLATVVDKQTGEKYRESRVVLFGYPLFRKDFIMPLESYTVIRVIFTPGSLFKLLGGLPISVMTNKILSGDEVIGNELNEVNEQLANSSSPVTMIGIVEKYLFRKMNASKCPTNSIWNIAQVLRSSQQKLSIDRIADHACLSSRQFNRRFTEEIGIGPKMFSRISRFHRAFSYKEKNPAADWNLIADQFGYSDYHHLSKDFKQLSGVTPPVLFIEGLHGPDKVLTIEQ